MFAVTARGPQNGSTVSGGRFRPENEAAMRGTAGRPELRGSMLKGLLVIAAAAAIAVGSGYADQSGKIVIPVNRTAANDGHEMYVSYCAPCHGTDAKGHGPAATALKASPSDLTLLRKNNQGRFPDSHIVAILQFGNEVSAHGSATMPVWGPILGKMNRTNAQDKQQRISNLSRYLQSIQER